MIDRYRNGATEGEMSESGDSNDQLIHGVARVLRTPEPAAPDFTARLMALVNAETNGTMAFAERHLGARSWWRRSRTLQLSISPMGALAAAALAAVALLGVQLTRGTTPVSNRAGVIASATPALGATVAHSDTVHLVRFVLLAPRASSVVMVGDFNNWNRGVTPLRRAGHGGTWSVSVVLPAGLHQYAFIVDGTKWTPDPAVSTTVSDEFKTMTSVIAIGGAS